MPEIGEIARIVHYLKKHLVGRTIAAVKTQHDEIIYGKAGTSAEAFEAAMKGKKVIDARQQGKYFWLVMSTPPHPLMHFGMTGWMKFSNDDSAYYKPAKPEPDHWPPRFWKFILQLKDEPKCEVAFVDARRLGRIRLIDVEGDKMRETYPLKRNGPDPVLDKDILTTKWLGDKLGSKKIPIKALLLDQGNISGIGNWVADEILYQAKMHPEQYSDTLDDTQVEQLHKSLIHVCTTAVEILAQPEDIPDNWLVKYRWSKGKKDKNTLPNGNKIIFLTVGGRTSAVVPEVQKKTGPVSADVPAEAATNSKNADSSVTNIGSGKKKNTEDKKRTASTAALPKKLPRGKRQRLDDVLQIQKPDVDLLKQELREELKQELKGELKHELRQELKKEIEHHVKLVKDAQHGSKVPTSQMISVKEHSPKHETDMPNNFAANDNSRRRSARLKG